MTLGKNPGRYCFANGVQAGIREAAPRPKSKGPHSVPFQAGSVYISAVGLVIGQVPSCRSPTSAFVAKLTQPIMTIS